MTSRQARTDFKAGKKRALGRQEKTPRQARKDSKAGYQTLKGRLEI
jgi:hypothetical protein